MSTKFNLENSLHQQNTIKIDDLSLFERILLVTDGTLTDILQAYLSEGIEIVKISENLVNSTQIKQEFSNFDFNLNENEQVIERKVLLQGKNSGDNFIYAHSFIIIQNLPEEFKNDLLNTKIPIGKLWFQHRIETFKEIIKLERKTAHDLSQYFHIKREDNLLERTYLVFSHQKLIMIISEHFPENIF
jgi:chorismate-pyruvate lyase